MTIVRQKIPVCIMFDDLFKKMADLVISPEKRLEGAFLLFFFIYMLINKERPFRVFVGEHLSLCGGEIKIVAFPLPTSFDFDFGWIVDRSSSTEVGENFNSSLGQTGRRSTKKSSHC